MGLFSNERITGIIIFYLGLTVLSIPVLIYLDREQPVIDELYCYHPVDDSVKEAIVVSDRYHVDELIEVYNSSNKNHLLASSNLHIFPIPLPINEKVKVHKFIKDSTAAYISYRNRNYRGSNEDLAYKQAYIPVFLLHRKPFEK